MKIEFKLLIVVFIMLTIFSVIRVPAYASGKALRTNPSTNYMKAFEEERTSELRAIEERLGLIQRLAVIIAVVLMVVGFIELAKYSKKNDDEDYSDQLSEDEISRKRKSALNKIKFSVYILIFIVCASYAIGILLY